MRKTEEGFEERPLTEDDWDRVVNAFRPGNEWGASPGRLGAEGLRAGHGTLPYETIKKWQTTPGTVVADMNGAFKRKKLPFKVASRRDGAKKWGSWGYELINPRLVLLSRKEGVEQADPA